MTNTTIKKKQWEAGSVDADGWINEGFVIRIRGGTPEFVRGTGINSQLLPASI